MVWGKNKGAQFTVPTYCPNNNDGFEEFFYQTQNG
jgi:hypothetical protein